MKRGNTKPPTLDPMFNSAVLGCSVSPLSKPRLVYSLPRLAALVRIAEAVELAEAHGIVLDMIQQAIAKHGPIAPIFVDDTHDLMQQSETDQAATN